MGASTITRFITHGSAIHPRPDTGTSRLWGKNLSDEDVKQRLFDLSSQDLVGQKFIALADPRTYGVTLRMNF